MTYIRVATKNLLEFLHFPFLLLTNAVLQQDKNSHADEPTKRLIFSVGFRKAARSCQRVVMIMRDALLWTPMSAAFPSIHLTCLRFDKKLIPGKSEAKQSITRSWSATVKRTTTKLGAVTEKHNYVGFLLKSPLCVMELSAYIRHPT